MSRDYERKGDNPVSEEAATKTETEQGAELENLVEAVRIHSEFDTINQASDEIILFVKNNKYRASKRKMLEWSKSGCFKM